VYRRLEYADLTTLPHLSWKPKGTDHRLNPGSKESACPRAGNLSSIPLRRKERCP
jgi:hypothetical protein